MSDGVAAGLDAAIAALLAASAAGDQGVALARAANGVSAPMSAVYAPYGPWAPPALLTLDYLGRELELDGMSSDMTGGQRHVDMLAAAWQGVRPTVVAKGGTTQATSYDSSVTRERSAIAVSDAATLSSVAHSQLDLVDAIELLFPAPDKPD